MPYQTPEARVLEHLRILTDGADSLLDVGCGLGTYLHALPIRWRIALDAHAPYLEHVIADVKIDSEALEALELMAPASVDAVICIDMIEHVEKWRGRLILQQMRRVAKEVVAVFTPLGFHPQEGDAWDMGGEIWQRHRSGWLPGDFEMHGYVAETWSDFSHGKPDLPSGALWGTWCSESWRQKLVQVERFRSRPQGIL